MIPPINLAAGNFMNMINISIMEETDMVGLPTDTKGLGTDPSQKQSLPVILIASKGQRIYRNQDNFIIV
jgi:hypothetical protein